jgi:hypothetical protein
MKVPSYIAAGVAHRPYDEYVSFWFTFYMW